MDRRHQLRRASARARAARHRRASLRRRRRSRSGRRRRRVSGRANGRAARALPRMVDDHERQTIDRSDVRRRSESRSTLRRRKPHRRAMAGAIQRDSRANRTSSAATTSLATRGEHSGDRPAASSGAAATAAIRRRASAVCAASLSRTAPRASPATAVDHHSTLARLPHALALSRTDAPLLRQRVRRRHRQRQRVCLSLESEIIRRRLLASALSSRPARHRRVEALRSSSRRRTRRRHRRVAPAQLHHQLSGARIARRQFRFARRPRAARGATTRATTRVRRRHHA